MDNLGVRLRIGKIYHLTGPQSGNTHFYAQGYSKALGRTISYQDIPVEPWRAELLERGLPVHLVKHLATMAEPAPGVALRPNVGRRAHADGAIAAARAGFGQEACGGVHRAGKTSLSVRGLNRTASMSTSITPARRTIYLVRINAVAPIFPVEVSFVECDSECL